MTVQGSQLTNPEYAALALLDEAKKAREDMSKFYELVMKHELTKAPLLPAPHQQLMFDFATFHEKAVLRMPVGTGKTYGMGAMTLWLIGADVTQRGAIISKTRTQAQKVLSMVKDYIEEPTLNPPLIMVYPNLKRSTRQQDPWTQSAIAIERPPGIRDPSLVAAGLGFSISGARLSWLLTDDVIDDENTANRQLREDVQSKFDGRLISRMDPTNSRVIVCNTPWHREDLTYHLEQRAGWPTLVMDIYGYIRITNAAAAWMNHALNVYLRPSMTRVEDEFDWYRLKAFDPDPDEQTPLWEERYSKERIREIRYGKDGKGGMLPHEFARLFLCQPLADDAARCQRDWVEKCKRKGMGETLLSHYEGNNPTYTGIDLGIGVTRRHDLTVFFTAEILPDGTRRLIDIESGRYSGPVIVEKLIQKSIRYKSALWVEGNAAQQYLIQFAQQKDKSLRIQSHTTTRANKQNLDFGVESVFTELKNEAWIIPCDAQGKCDSEVQEWVNEMLYYQPPPAHTGDRLMASWICREAIRKGGRTRLPPKIGRKREMASVGQF